MSFDSLPIEVIRHIAFFVGADYLRKYPQVVTLSKTWFEIAHPIRLEARTLRLAEIRQFTLLGLSGYKEPEGFCKFSSYTQSVTLYLEGGQAVGKRTGLLTQRSISNHELAKHVKAVAQHLQYFCCIAEITIHTELAIIYPEFPMPAVRVSALMSLLSKGRLQHVNLDLCGSPLMRGKNDGHFCEQVSKMIPNLTTFNCRMSNVCPCILSVEAASTEFMKTERIAINLCIDVQDEGDGAFRCASECNNPLAGTIYSVKRMESAFKNALKLFTKSMVQKRTAYVVYHSVVYNRQEVFDAISGQQGEWKKSSSLRNSWLPF